MRTLFSELMLMNWIADEDTWLSADDESLESVDGLGAPSVCVERSPGERAAFDAEAKADNRLFDQNQLQSMSGYSVSLLLEVTGGLLQKWHWVWMVDNLSMCQSAN